MLMTILSGLFGGILRLAPELLKFFDAKNDRAHELAMQDKQLAFLQAQGTLKVEEARLTTTSDMETARFETLKAALIAEGAMAAQAGPLASFINALVRPAVTFGVFTLWAICRIALIAYSFHATGNVTESLMNAWTQDDASLLAMIASFYFVGRSIEKKQ